ncbi:hypothetical protein MANI_026982 [Metarhizium anisopliae]|nr:hypothetical protein MANI_026982 [Metarhizium anisopliae]
MTLQVGDKYHVQCQPPNTSVGSSEGHHRVISGYGNVSQKLNCLRITRSFKGAQDFEVLEAAWVHEYVPSQVFSSISEVKALDAECVFQHLDQHDSQLSQYAIPRLDRAPSNPR